MFACFRVKTCFFFMSVVLSFSWHLPPLGALYLVMFFFVVMWFSFVSLRRPVIPLTLSYLLLPFGLSKFIAFLYIFVSLYSCFISICLLVPNMSFLLASFSTHVVSLCRHTVSSLCLSALLTLSLHSFTFHLSPFFQKQIGLS